jgi:malate dehydrogenase (oxaloacetate-decarboxylating)(NADP+)
MMDIPVFHDDQHGTAIISGAALLNALELAGKDIAQVRMAVSGAGAAAISCCEFFISLGMRRENIVLIDTRGVVYRGRTDGMNVYKERFATDLPARTLAEALDGADVFLGVSVAGAVTKKMVRSMADRPIVFALANPDPEVDVDAAHRLAAVLATGRSDYPNQINNVLAFPGVFRGLLDARAHEVTTKMLLRAADALAHCVTDEQLNAAYIVPSVFDPSVPKAVAAAVREAATVAAVPAEDAAMSVPPPA